MKRLGSLLVFLLAFLCFSTVGSAGAISWGGTKEAKYDTSIPGTNLPWSGPLSLGGMNLETGKMTRGTDADVAFSRDGAEMGANGIVGLGKVKYDSVNQIPGSGFQELIKVEQGNVYIIKRKNGNMVKLQITSISNSVVTFKYALEKSYTPKVTSIKFKEKLKYSPTSVSLSVIANYSDKTKAVVKSSSAKWTSNNKNVAKVDSKGKITFTGKPGKVTITATYKGKKTSATTTVGNVVKKLSTTTKLTYSKKPIKVNVTAIYMNGKKVKLKSGVVWKSSNKNVAKVSSTGVVTFTGKNGNATITATYKGKKLTLKTTVARVDNYYGKWKLWIPGTMVDYFYKDTGNYAGSRYKDGAYKGSLTVNKNGTYTLNSKTGKWRVAKKSEVFNHPVSIILLKAEGKNDIAITDHDRKKGYIKLMVDSKGKYTDGSKIWIFAAEGFK
ncbi:Ig-like domain-containing protein [Lederbergia panacisoli]|uniref:Ig-like domain-containing protein n=1 Tax=Lederbergia panacisoli TaxID=1255251 RepID=UPI00214BB348|nr:Ig-like domain-containing protein [Lederbergia panacisoli]MCR2822768.1 Ig-like domain-containing protein [Lederbergia panacisoli]